MSRVAAVGRRPAVDRVDPALSPAAERLSPPRWRDGRLVFGVLLVLISVLLGARVLSSADHTTSVLTASRVLPAGHVLEPGDVRVRNVRLSGIGGRYWPGSAGPGLVGHPLLTAVGEGDLLARSAVADTVDPQPYRIVSLPLDPARLPQLHRGDLVDVFATYKATTSAAGRTSAVLRGVEYVGGSDSTGTRVAIEVRVPVAAAADAVRASQVAELDVIRQDAAGDDAGEVGLTASEPTPVLVDPTPRR